MLNQSSPHPTLYVDFGMTLKALASGWTTTINRTATDPIQRSKSGEDAGFDELRDVQRQQVNHPPLVQVPKGG